MEFSEKLQQLRKQKEITQEQLAESIYVSRTAVSKWESGRGYPSIESLKAIAKFFSVTVDELLSTDEVFIIAEEEQRQKGKRLLTSVLGLLDVCFVMLLFLPFFAQRTESGAAAVSLFALASVHPLLKAAGFIAVIGTAVFGVLTLAFQSFDAAWWLKSKNKISLAFSVFSVLLFTLCLHPYAAAFSLFLLAIKAFIMMKNR